MRKLIGGASIIAVALVLGACGSTSPVDPTPTSTETTTPVVTPSPSFTPSPTPTVDGLDWVVWKEGSAYSIVCLDLDFHLPEPAPAVVNFGGTEEFLWVYVAGRLSRDHVGDGVFAIISLDQPVAVDNDGKKKDGDGFIDPDGNVILNEDGSVADLAEAEIDVSSACDNARR